ncbi:MAG: Hsp70 family protein [Verrucomicrobiota bacterium]
MAAPKFSIGIDLGTTNCAMSFVPLAGENATTEVFVIPQWETTDRLIESNTLPSFLYLPTAAEAAQLHGAAASDKAAWVCGRIARKRAAETPGRVAHSAKSWLGHHAVDRGIGFLPWGSDEIPPEQKISPIRASALLLNYLRGAWDTRFPQHPFNAQDITVTVPASFDAVAQRLTLDAAAEAGFPKSVRLLEEPQAAFYRWLESHSDSQALWNQLAHDGPSHVLVVDIGGGTSDFSLFEIRRHEGSSLPAIRRVAVSDHLLLGGDNIDLALARLLEPRLAGKDETLSGSQWQDLVARCRDLKESCLAADGEPDEAFPVTLPGRGSGLFAGSLSAKISRAEVMTILLDGFYPECAADARPTEADAALREWGLPYAADSAITRYLADFLRDLPPVDAILFNGGSLYPEALRQRISRQIGSWQDGNLPTTLDNPEPDLAVARGAARYGNILHHRSARIQAGAARSIYLEVHQAGKASLLCVLPRGSEPEEIHAIAHPGLELRLNRPVRFQCYYSTRHDKDRPGALVPLKHEDFHRMPPLQTIARLTGKAAGESLSVSLTAKLTELGLLHLECVSADPSLAQAWPLAFNLRAGAAGGVVVGESDPGVDTAKLTSAKERIVAIFSAPFTASDPLTAARLLKSLEDILESPKSEWNLMLVRALWTTLKRCIPCRVNSVEHEEAWLILAGFFLRPGFGAELDPVRIDDLWNALKDGPVHPGKQIRLQRHILLRRLAGGLDRERQQVILDAELPGLSHQQKPAAELVRLVGSLERIDLTSKLALIDLFLTRSVNLAESGGYAAPYWVSLGLLLNRTPLYTGAESVVPPDLVVRAFEMLRDLDWKSSPDLAELFLRAARVTDDRALDVPKPIRKEIARKLAKAKVPPHKVTRIEEFIPIDRSEQVSLYGESLPPGLLMEGT